MAPRKSSRAKPKAINYNEDSPGPEAKPSKATGNTRKRKADPEAEEKENGEEKEEEKLAVTAKSQQESAPVATKKRKTKTKKGEDDEMPLAERTAVSALGKAMYIGAHVSAAGGVQNAVTNAVQIGANAFALFLKSQRKWDNPALAPEARTEFLSGCKHHDYDAAAHALPHGSYLVNLAQREKAKADQAYGAFVDDLRRCSSLGIGLYNFHPGNTGGEPREEAIARIAAQLDKAHADAGTGRVVTVLENMAGGGNVVGSSWEDLRDIIALVKEKDRVGVCIDTCHAFAAGHDLRTPKAFDETIEAFDSIVGLKYLKAFHLNDSKAPFNSHRDLHANIGTGFLGLRAFHSLMNTEAFAGMPMVLETPIDSKDDKGKTVENKQIWADEIKLLESLIGMDPESDEFKSLEVDLQEKGEGERKKIQEQVDKKTAKDAKKDAKKAKKS